MDQLGVAGKTNGGQIVTLDRGTPCRDAHRLHSVGMIEYPVQGINDAIVVEKVHQQPVLFVLYHFHNRRRGRSDDDAATGHGLYHRPRQDKSISQIDVNR